MAVNSTMIEQARLAHLNITKVEYPNDPDKRRRWESLSKTSQDKWIRMVFATECHHIKQGFKHRKNNA